METIKVKDQEIFEKVKEHLLKQMFKSVDELGNCKYRGYDPKIIEEITHECVDKFDEQFDYDFDAYVYDAIWSTNPTAMCAVGCLITDEHYHDGLEDNAIDGMVEEAVLESNPNWYYSNASQSMLYTLQQIHDTFDVCHWENLLTIVGNCFDENGSFDLTAYEANSIRKYREEQVREKLSKW